MSLQDLDRDIAKLSVAARVSLADIEAAIGHRYDITAEEATLDRLPGYAAPGFGTDNPAAFARLSDGLQILSICILVLKNGFIIIGKSAPASPENFNAELGRDLAYRDACNQCWPLMGFALRDRLHSESQT